MKNFPHQFNKIERLFDALGVVKQFVKEGIALTDSNFGEQLTRKGVYTYRNKTLSVDQYLAQQQEISIDNRGYLTVARDIRRFFELLGFIILFPDKMVKLNIAAKQLLQTKSKEIRKGLWKDAMLQLGLEGTDGEISHPYRILLQIVSKFPGVDTCKLMLALEAENDSEEEFERISALAKLSFNKIIREISTTLSMAKNAVKILPGIAEQLGDLERKANQAYPIGRFVVTEDEISADEKHLTPRIEEMPFRKVTSLDIAKAPALKVVLSASFDLSDAIKKRQKRLVEHQEIVRLLATLNEKYNISLFEGKFDCLGTKGDTGLLYEVKTILESGSDQEKQTVKGIGQLKYYKFSIVRYQEGLTKIKEVLVFSAKPDDDLIEFCTAEKVTVIWRVGDFFYIHNASAGTDKIFNPNNLLIEKKNDKYISSDRYR